MVQLVLETFRGCMAIKQLMLSFLPEKHSKYFKTKQGGNAFQGRNLTLAALIFSCGLSPVSFASYNGLAGCLHRN